MTRTGKPIGKLSGEAKVQLHPSSQIKFFIREFEAQITFHLDASGLVSDLTLHRFGQQTHAARIDERSRVRPKRP